LSYILQDFCFWYFSFFAQSQPQPKILLSTGSSYIWPPTYLGWPAHTTTPAYWLEWILANFLSSWPQTMIFPRPGIIGVKQHAQPFGNHISNLPTYFLEIILNERNFCHQSK
jgi:hypothetical protein